MLKAKVRNRQLDSSGGLADSGFYVGGPALQAGMEWRRFISKAHFISFEQKWSLAYTRFPIRGGHASGVNAAWHLTLRWGTQHPSKNDTLTQRLLFWSPLVMPFALDAVFPTTIEKPVR